MSIFSQQQEKAEQNSCLELFFNMREASILTQRTDLPSLA
jgi:hypothetical protein